MTAEDLLRKFFSNTCTKEEADAAMLLLKENPELVDEFLSQKDWDDTEVDKELPIEISSEMKEGIFKQTRPSRTVIKMFQRISIAACLAGFLFFGYKFLNLPGSREFQISRYESSRIEVTENTGNEKLVLRLSDGSEVRLSPGGKIRYEKEFKGDKRDVFLEGEALFDVAKDKRRPFSVISNGIKTTALGTQFYVSNVNKGQQRIRLIEGKVVIDAEQKIPAINRVYLVAGQECLLSIGDRSALVKNTNPVSQMKSASSRSTNPQPLPMVSLSFAQSPITRVLQSLSQHYNTKIIFNESDLSGVYFTGRILEKDSLERAIEMVCEMNTLRFKIEPELVRIEKGNPK